MSERWKLEEGVFAGDRTEYVDWDAEVRTPPVRTEERSCYMCGVRYAAYIDVSDVGETEGLRRIGTGEPYATERRRWRETTTSEAHLCQPHPRITEVTACQFTRMGRGLVPPVP